MLDLKSEETANHYFDVDVVENAIDSLETAVYFLERSDGLKWKWIGFALHHALYSFCVAALENSTYEWVLSCGKDDKGVLCKRGDELKFKRSRKTFRKNSPAYIIKWEDTDEKPSEPESVKHKRQTSRERLIGFWTALARVQDSYFWMSRLICSRALTLSEDEWQSIEWLTRFRNNLTHFIPTSWKFSVPRIKKACFDFLRPIEFLAFESFTIPDLLFRGDDLKERIHKALTKLHENLGNQG